MIEVTRRFFSLSSSLMKAETSPVYLVWSWLSRGYEQHGAEVEQHAFAGLGVVDEVLRLHVVVHDAVLVQDREAAEEGLHVADGFARVVPALDRFESLSVHPVHHQHHLVREEDRFARRREHLVALQQLHVEQLLRRVVEAVVREVHLYRHADRSARASLRVVDRAVASASHLVLHRVLLFERPEPHRLVQVVASSHLRLVRCDRLCVAQLALAFALPRPDDPAVLAFGPLEVLSFPYHCLRCCSLD